MVYPGFSSVIQREARMSRIPTSTLFRSSRAPPSASISIVTVNGTNVRPSSDGSSVDTSRPKAWSWKMISRSAEKRCRATARTPGTFSTMS
jgi:hypothetical protein